MKNISPFSRAAGFSLLELVVVLAVTIFLAAFIITPLAGRHHGAGLAQDVAQQVRERSSAAVRLAALTAPTSLEQYRQPPLLIDFNEPSTTAALRVEGQDRDSDGRDDDSGLALTHFVPPDAPDGYGRWDYAYQGAPLALPPGWRVVTDAGDLRPAGLIPGSQLTTVLDFDTQGRVATRPAYQPNPDPNRENTFWAVYFTNGAEFVAVGVQQTGLTEVWQWHETESRWRGRAGRAKTEDTS